MERLKKRTNPTIHQWNTLLDELEAEKAVNYFATSLLTQSTIQQVLWDVVRNCISRLGFVDCVIYWLDQERGMLVQKAAYGPKNPEADLILKPIEIPLGTGIVGAVAASRKAERIGNTSADSRYIQDDYARPSEITVPILLDGNVLGIIDAEHPEPHFFTPQHLRILTAVATVCAQKINQVVTEQAYRQAGQQLMETNKRVAETKLLALRMQMNPHFIFNSLNSINSLILQNEADQASTLLTKFSRLMRQILDNSRTDWVPLRNELKALRIYVELEQLRCDNRFEVSFQISDALDQDLVRVPPLIMQPYVENAIWHGLLPQKEDIRQLLIVCRKAENRLIIEIIDNGIGREASSRLRQNLLTNHKEYGVNLIEERLRLMNEMYDVDGTITYMDQYHKSGLPAGTCVNFTLKLPAS
ncbi:MAG: histidine kinase [Spirosoma sp.]|nr:histidine kinase [Spirosoma sp.]